MRIRTIKPEFWSHPVMGKQSDATRLLAIGLLNYADDEGYFYADEKLIRNALRPFDDDSRITTVSLRELSKIGFISIRESESHGPIGFVLSFSDHQVINKPKSSKIKGLHNSGSNTVVIPDGYRLEGKGKEGKGKDLICPPTGDEPVALEKLALTIWQACPKMGRERSSKKDLLAALKKIPKRELPTTETLSKAMAAWCACQKWTESNGAFVGGIHLWVDKRQWENLPEPASQPKADEKWVPLFPGHRPDK